MKILINTKDNFEYGGDGSIQPWGGYPDASDDNDTIITTDHYYDLVESVPPVMHLTFNERHGDISVDNINGLTMENTVRRSIGNETILSGYSVRYNSADFYSENEQAHMSVPNNIIRGDSQGSIEVNFKIHAAQLNAELNIIAIRNSSNEVSDRWEQMVGPVWATYVNGVILEIDNEKILRIIIRHVDSTNNVVYGLDGLDNEVSFDTVFRNDGIYNLTIAIDERRALWAYINGELKRRFCGIQWCNIPDDYIVHIGNYTPMTSEFRVGDSISYDSIAIYNKVLTMNVVKAHWQALSKMHDMLTAERTYLRNNNKALSIGGKSVEYVIDGYISRTLSYDETWNVSQDSFTSKVYSASSSYDHTVFCNHDGTLFAKGNSANGRHTFTSISDAIYASAGLDFTAILTEYGSVNVVHSGTDPWGIRNVPASANMVDVKAGSQHIVSLQRDGTVTCWGRNDDGQCNVPINLSRVSQIAAGDGFTAAIDGDGFVRCWGEIPDAFNVIRAVQIEASGDNLLVLTPHNEIRVFGPYNNTHSPNEIINELSAGRYGYAFVTNHRSLYTFGEVLNDILEAYTLDMLPNNFMFRVNADDAYIKQIESGVAHGIALLSNGIYHVWNQSGSEFLNGNIHQHPPIIKPVKQISTGTFAVALYEDGTIDSWGGRFNNGQRDVPVGLSDVVYVYTHDYTGIAIRSTGEVVTWGSTWAFWWLPPSVVPNIRRMAVLPDSQTVAILTDNYELLIYVNGDVINVGHAIDFMVDDTYANFWQGGTVFFLLLKRDGKVETVHLDPSQAIGTLERNLHPLLNTTPVSLSGASRRLAFTMVDGTAYTWEVEGTTEVGNAVSIPSEHSDISRISMPNLFQYNNLPIADTLGGEIREWASEAQLEIPDVLYSPDLSFTADIVSFEFIIDTLETRRIRLPFAGSNLTVDWGDDTGIQAITSSSGYNHEYPIKGRYRIKITGTINNTTLSTFNNPWPLIEDIRQWGTQTLFDISTFVLGNKMKAGAIISATDMPLFVRDVSFENIFAFNEFGPLNVSHWDTIRVFDLRGAFRNSNFNEDISQWEVFNVIDTESAFTDNPMFNQDISSWQTINVSKMRFMFAGASAFIQDISLWNVDNVTQANSFAVGSPLESNPQFVPAFNVPWQ